MLKTSVLVRLLLNGILTLLLLSCAPRRSSPADQPPEAMPAGLHAIQDEQIREIMGRLAVPMERMPQEVESASRRRRLLDEMADLASALEDNAHRIPEILQGVRMTDTHRSEFLQYARQLANQAAELRTHARSNELEAARETYDRIDETCRQCHERFRVLPISQKN